ncbi:MAG: hypothetical protein KAU49_03565 [Candidatus Krumholzibacteria bacterium]|nr:hypothetical protein [Candidatus Krumholzibacteria bacterium]
MGQSFVEGEFENSTALSFETGFRSGERTRVRMQILYPIIRRDGGYVHGFGDLMLSTELRIVGDTLRINGLFLRGDMRIPTGSASRWPYAGESLDGGGGLELRRLYEAFDFRCSMTYTLSGRKVEEEFYRSENYGLAGILFGVKPFRELTLEFSAFAQFFRNGDYREVYLIGAGTRLKGGLDVRVCAGIDNGETYERVWNSMIQIGITWRFPETWKRKPDTDETVPGLTPSGSSQPVKTTP